MLLKNFDVLLNKFSFSFTLRLFFVDLFCHTLPNFQVPAHENEAIMSSILLLFTQKDAEGRTNYDVFLHFHEGFRARASSLSFEFLTGKVAEVSTRAS